MPITPRGLIYPDSSAHTRTWEHWQALAESTDAALSDLAAQITAGLPRMAAGRVNIVFAAVTQVQVAVTLPAGRFTDTPRITMTMVGGPGTAAGSAWLRTTGSVGPTGFTIVMNTSAPMSATFAVDWTALQLAA